MVSESAVEVPIDLFDDGGSVDSDAVAAVELVEDRFADSHDCRLAALKARAHGLDDAVAMLGEEGLGLFRGVSSVMAVIAGGLVRGQEIWIDIIFRFLDGRDENCFHGFVAGFDVGGRSFLHERPGGRLALLGPGPGGQAGRDLVDVVHDGDDRRICEVGIPVVAVDVDGTDGEVRVSEAVSAAAEVAVLRIVVAVVVPPLL